MAKVTIEIEDKDGEAYVSIRSTPRFEIALDEPDGISRKGLTEAQLTAIAANDAIGLFKHNKRKE
jgi:hypothetical protein